MTEKENWYDTYTPSIGYFWETIHKYKMQYEVWSLATILDVVFTVCSSSEATDLKWYLYYDCFTSLETSKSKKYQESFPLTMQTFFYRIVFVGVQLSMQL